VQEHYKDVPFGSAENVCLFTKTFKLFGTEMRQKFLSNKKAFFHRCYKTIYGRNLLMFNIRWTVGPWQAFPALSNACE
jgi:hypothetical protein